MAITTVLAALVAIQWGFPPAAVLAVNGVFFVIDLVFFAANSVKLLEGGWFPLMLALLVAFLMLTWRRGNALLERQRADLREPESKLVDACGINASGVRLLRLPTSAAYLSAGTSGLPLPLSHFMRINRAVQKRVLIVSAVTTERPRVPLDKRAQVVPLGQGIDRLILTYGFDEAPSVPDGIALALERGLLQDVDPAAITYIVGRETVIPSRQRDGLARWRKKVFAFMARNSERTAVYFGVPTAQAVELGLEIEL